ncbi:MAG: RdgB/HAM1 family non-canonical purine NTP pyrophosphatase [Coriobacteriales bacterium]|jgi:XTP/dITP diphosphohydrolase|nr:RdgB/HAM1 family non-canonical purine NTP pyrophosphatase [Coriobacteriales bacterium]
MGAASKNVIVATHNAHKAVELGELLEIPGWKLLPLSACGLDELPPETASTFEGNARIKARGAFAASGHAVLADDSGLLVDALGGAPGVHSARYANEQASDAANVKKLLAELEGVPADKRGARFVCTMVFIDEDGTELVATGSLEGHIAAAPRGAGGFGYDPVFVPQAEHDGRTLAEYEPAEKNALSHRACAAVDLRRQLEAAARVPSRAQAPAAEAATSNEAAPAAAKTRIVAFDFDGTLIDAASPVRLVNRLARNHIMPMKAVARIGLWGMRYKMGAELDQSLPRRYIFSSFKQFSASDANSIMTNLYNEEIRSYYRPDALRRIKRHRAEGCTIVVVSASFEPIVSAAVKDIGADGFIATKMEVVDGHYTGHTLCEPPEGEQKLFQLTSYADECFGEGNWELDWAYGDHFSDAPLMEAARHAVAVDPDRRLERIAHANGWEIVKWEL